MKNIPVNNFIGKAIFNERFIVKNHPLDDWNSEKENSEGMTYVDVIVVDGKAIGGTSFPYTKDSYVGMPYSLKVKL